MSTAKEHHGHVYSRRAEDNLNMSVEAQVGRPGLVEFSVDYIFFMFCVFDYA